MDFRRRSNSRERIRREPSDNVTYDRNIGDGDEVSIGVEWSGLAAWVSISKAQKWESFQPNKTNAGYFAIFWERQKLEWRAMADWIYAGLLFACFLYFSNVCYFNMGKTMRNFMLAKTM